MIHKFIFVTSNPEHLLVYTQKQKVLFCMGLSKTFVIKDFFSSIFDNKAIFTPK